MSDNAHTLSARVALNYQTTHQEILELAQRMSEEQLHWRATPEALPIAFHLWHVARWADHLQASIPGMTPELSRTLPAHKQVWESEQLAQRWGFAGELGYAGTGMEMSEQEASRLHYPSQDELLAYAAQVFAAAEKMVAAIPRDEWDAMEQPQELTEGILGDSTVGDAIVSHLVHDNRHLGAMESLLGLQTGGGSATT